MGQAVEFTEKAVQEYLDEAIRLARKQREAGRPEAVYYVDAFQSVRISLLGELLPEEKEEQ